MNKAKQLSKTSNFKISDEATQQVGEISSFLALAAQLKSKIKLVLLLFLVIVGVYLNSLWGEFLSDDVTAIVDFKDLGNFPLQLKTLYVQHFFQSAIINIFGVTPFPFHVLSVLLHILTVVSFFALLLFLFSSEVAFFASLLFALYPVNVESVSWISGVNYVYMALFLFLTTIFYFLYKNSQLKKYLYTSLAVWVICLIGFRSPWLASFPLILVMLTIYKDKKVYFEKTLAFYFLPLLGLVYSLYHDYSTRAQVLTSLGAGHSEQGTYFQRIFNSYYKFLELLIWPFVLTLYHEGDRIGPLYQMFMYILTIASIFIVGYMLKRKNFKVVFFLISVVSLAPLFSPVQVAWVVAERYLYLSTAFYSLSLVLFVKYISVKYGKQIFAWVLVLISIAFGVKVIMRNQDWKNFKNFAISNASVSPNSPQALNALGNMYFLEGDMQKSTEAFKKSIEGYPEYAIAIHNLGRNYYLQDDLENAEKNFKKALEINPNMHISMTALGIIELKRGNKDRALMYAEEALKIDPENEMANRLKNWVTTGKIN